MQNVAISMHVKHLLNGTLTIYRLSDIVFLLIIMKKLLRKPVLVRKSLFQLLWHWFLLFLSFLHRKLAIQICFCKVAGENGKKLLPETFLSYQKGISPMDVFIILQLFRGVHLRCKWFSSENKERKTKLLQKIASRSGILTFLTLLTFQHYWVLMRNRLYFWAFLHWPELKDSISHCYLFPDGSVWLIFSVTCEKVCHI